jgi:prepilin-type N-terminal cleavage/methylation domain-containing protein
MRPGTPGSRGPTGRLGRGFTGRLGRGFTLIELLVAIALSTILTGAVVFIFIQAQEIFISVDAKVQVYQYARFAFDRIERDLGNVTNSRDMEFFNDQAPPSGTKNRHDVGEELPIRGTANNDASNTGDDTYNHGFTLRQPALYTDVDKGLQHRWDSIYFKTITRIGGQTSATLIEYAVVDTDKPRPKLQRRLWRVTGVDAGNPLAPRYEINGPLGGQPQRQDLCLYTMDCKLEVFVKNFRRSDGGAFYSAAQLVTPPKEWNREVNLNSEPSIPPMKNDWRGGNSMVQCYYDAGHNEARMQPDLGVFEPGENGLFHTQDNFGFPMLREGDAIYLWGGFRGFKGRPYTIKKILMKDASGGLVPWAPATGDMAQMRIQFDEPIEGQRPNQQMLVRYAAGFVPAALRATVVIKDSKSLANRSVSRVFKIMSN